MTYTWLIALLYPFARRGGGEHNRAAMDIDPHLYVEIHPFDGPHSPHPHPINEAHFDPAFVYKVLGMHNPSETSECYFVLANPRRQIWFIPQRHLLAYRLIASEEFFLPRDTTVSPAAAPLEQQASPAAGSVTSKLARGRISGADVQIRLANPDRAPRYGKGY